jgi:hypothetical protein
MSQINFTNKSIKIFTETPEQFETVKEIATTMGYKCVDNTTHDSMKPNELAGLVMTKANTLVTSSFENSNIYDFGIPADMFILWHRTMRA